MTQELPEREARCKVAAPGDLPTLEVVVHVAVEIELAGLHQLHHGYGENRLADGARLENGGGSHGIGAARLAHAEAARPIDAVVMDDGNAHTRCEQVRQALGETGGRPVTATERGLGQ